MGADLNVDAVVLFSSLLDLLGDRGVDGWVMLTSGGSPNSRVMVVVVVEVVPGDVSRRRLTTATPSSDTILKEHWNISLEFMS